MSWLGIDLGTSGVKAVLIGEDQTVLASATAGLTVSRPAFGWSEQAPEGWIVATESALARLRRDAPDAYARVRGIGLSGQMHGATLLGSGGDVLRPCMLWNDTRSHKQAALLDADPAFRKISGNIVFPGFTAPKLVWVRDNEPDVFDRIAKVLLPKDYLRHWLTGDHVSDMSDASGTAWLDVENRCWSDDLLAKTGLSRDHMPELVEGSAPSGRLRKSLAGELGLSGDVIVAGGAGDNAASAIGMGTVGSGEAFLSLGTSGVLFAANDRYRPNAESAVHAFCHALPGTWHQMGVILSATDCMNWLSGICGTAPADLARQLPAQIGEPTGLTFLPYLSGERTPHNDAAIRGVIAGIDHETGQAELTAAVMEGVGFAFRDCLAALEQAGTAISRATVVGGGANSSQWLQVLATILGIEIDVPASGDFGAAFGAARLGLMAESGADPLSVCTKPPIAATVAPIASLTASYDEAYQRYRALYPAMKQIGE